MRLGHAIRAARVERRMTQAQLARALGVDRTTVGNWERGRTTPLLSQLGPLCEALEVPCERFVEPPNRPEMTGRRRRRSA